MAKEKNKPRQASNEARAVLKLYRSSPRKLNLLAQQIRGLKVERALAELQFSPKRPAMDVRKLLQSAIANAENNHNLDVDALVVKEASVGKAITMKRWTPRARGRSAKIMKPISRIRIVVREADEAGE